LRRRAQILTARLLSLISEPAGLDRGDGSAQILDRSRYSSSVNPRTSSELSSPSVNLICHSPPAPMRPPHERNEKAATGLPPAAFDTSSSMPEGLHQTARQVKQKSSHIKGLPNAL
jgi:hypothetical protein